MYSATTRGIKVTVTPRFMPDESRPQQNRFFFAYEIEIENTGSETVQLLARHWRITDATGRTQEVRGPGVVGEKPVLNPGETFRYTSGVPLTTPSGIMAGTYLMTVAGGDGFEVAVPAFSLDSEETAVRSLH